MPLVGNKTMPNSRHKTPLMETFQVSKQIAQLPDEVIRPNELLNNTDRPHNKHIYSAL
jgi:hypothetical protein